MMCKFPIKITSKTGVHTVGCGRCFNCRVNKGRKWTARLLMEQKDHHYSWFITLSYRDEDLPPGDNLVLQDLQKYIRALRRSGLEVRYFGVGEYGSEKGRCHYHLALYGPSMEQIFGTTDYWEAAGGFATHSDKYWQKGRVHIGEINSTTAGYICGYTIKKLTENHELVVAGREPEFTIMSKKPPLGAPYMAEVCKHVLAAAAYHEDPEAEAVRLLENGRIRINQKVWPLDRTMLKTVFRSLAPSPDGQDQKKIRAELRYQIGQWTGSNERNQVVARSRADKAERRLRRLAVGRPF